MLRSASVDRVREQLLRLARGRLDVTSYRREAVALLRAAVPFDGWCWALTDPETLVIWDAVADNPPLIGRQRLVHEIDACEADVVPSRRRLAAGPPLHALSAATGGNLARSRRWVELYESWGVGDELQAALLFDGGCWAHLALNRERAAGPFSAEEIAGVRSLLGVLAAGLRRALLVAPFPVQPVLDGPGTVILGPDLAPVAATPMGRRWAALLQDRIGAGALNSMVCALAARLEALETRGAGELMPRVRTRAAGGQWLVVHAARLSGSSSVAGHLALVVEPARPTDVAPLAQQLYGLSVRERELTRLVLDGRSTKEIAGAMFISTYTVQDHLKTVFAKTGVRSRRELVATLAGQPGEAA